MFTIRRPDCQDIQTVGLSICLQQTCRPPQTIVYPQTFFHTVPCEYNSPKYANIMSSSFPYNVSISSDSPSITYLPYRDGALDGGWNMTCDKSSDLTWASQTFCSGVPSRRTTFNGASMLIEFEGTAVYLYGTASSGTYSVQIDDNVQHQFISDTPAGLLAQLEGMSNSKHRIYLNVTDRSIVTFWEAVLTIGLGAESDNGASIRNRTMVPFSTNKDGLTILNSFFSYTGMWNMAFPGPIGALGDVLYPRQDTSQTGAFVMFTLNQTSAFFVYGIVNDNLGQFSVSITPPSDVGKPFTNMYNSSGRWINLERVMYWTSGLDRDKEYSVKITNLGSGKAPFFAFSHVDLIDAGPKKTANTTGPGGTENTNYHKVSIGVIAGAAAGGVFFVVLLLIGIIYYMKTRRNNTVSPSRIPPELQAQVPYYVPLPINGPNVDPISMGYVSNSPLYYNLQQSPYVNDTDAGTALPTPQALVYPSSLPNSGQLVELTWEGADSNNNDSSRAGPSRVVRENDAGRISVPGENIVTLPPEYKDVWSQR